MGIEFELKYRATPEILAKVAAEVKDCGQRFAMETTYYDTKDRALSARRCTLRRRLENNISVCTLKMPAGSLGRAEFELECETIEKAIPELCKLSGFQELETLADAGLQAVCGARFQRLAIFVDIGDATLELALDAGVLMGGGKEEPFHELEIELKSGNRDAVVAYAKTLALRHGLVTEPQSKFRRASLLAGGK